MRHVIALDTKTGNLVWDVKAADSNAAYTFTVAPLVVKNEVIVGISGGEYGVRGFVDAYDADTGRRRWRFETVPGPGQPGHETWAGDSWKTGGAPAWITGSYDPELNLIYWPTGNPSPSDYGGERAGDNLYSNSMLALDADTRKAEMVLSIHSARFVRLRCHPGSGVAGCRTGKASRASCCCRQIATAFSTCSTAPTENFSRPRHSAR